MLSVLRGKFPVSSIKHQASSIKYQVSSINISTQSKVNLISDMTKEEAHLRAGLVALREARYFDAHEDWEIPWKDMTGDIRSFWQAMIQLSVGAYHYQKKNMTGCRNLWHKALKRCHDITERAVVRDQFAVDQLQDILERTLAAVARSADPLPGILSFARHTVDDSWFLFR